MSPVIESPTQDQPPIKARTNTGQSGASQLNRASRFVIELGDDYLVWSAQGGSYLRPHPLERGLILDSLLREPAVVQRYVTDLGHVLPKNCSVSLQLSTSDAILRSFFVPVVPKQELPQVVLWEATKIFPFSPDPGWFGWRVVNTLEWGGVRKYQIQAAALPPTRIEPISSALIERFNLEKITFTPLVWESLLQAQIKMGALPSAKSVAVVRLFGTRLGVLCYNNGCLEFTRESTLDSAVAGDDFDASLNFLQQAQSHQRDPHNYASYDLDALATLVAEELDFYYGRFSQRTIDTVYLALPPAICVAAQTAFKSTLGVAVEVAHEAFPAEPGDPHLFAPVEGPRSRNAASIDLTPRAYRRLTLERKLLRASAAASLLVCFAIIVAAIMQRGELGSLQQSATTTEQSLESVRSSTAYQDLQQMISHDDHWSSQFTALDHAKWSGAQLLKTLSNITPPETFLSDLQIQTVAGPDGTNRAAVSITGFVSDRTDYPEIQLARYIKSLAAEPNYAQVMLRNQYVGISDAGRRLHFTISLEVTS